MLKVFSTSCWSILLLLAGIGLNAPKAQAQAVTFSYIFDGLVLTGTSTQSGGTASNAVYGPGLGTKTFFAGNPGDAMAGDGFASGTPLSTANNDYFGFPLNAVGCVNVTLTSVSFDARRSGTGPANLEIRSSANGFSTALFTATLSGTNFESKSGAIPSVVIPGGQTVEFRLYGYSATGGTGTLRIDNVKFNGTVTAATPTAFSVTGGGAICPTVGTPVGLSGSQSNVNYQLKLNGSNVGSPLPGDGLALNFGDQTAFGTYTVVASTANGCSSTQTGSVVISQSPNCGGGGCAVTLSATPTNVSCFGAFTGSIDLTPSSGTAPYTYDWSNDGAENPDNDPQDLAGIGAGTYTVTVTDAAACSQTTSVTITQATAIVATTTQVNVLCNGNATGSIDLTISGGTSPYTYDWSNDGTENPDNDTQDLSGLAAGTYAVTVTDASGCTKVSSATISQPSVITLSATQVNVSCGAFGSIDLTVTGGTPGYSYLWSNGSLTQDVSNLTAGTYTVTVTDAVSCTKSTSVTITEGTGISLTLKAVNPDNCFVSNGSIDLTVSGGAAPFTYDWSNDGPETPDNDPQDLQNLPEGTYTVTVTDFNGCTATTSTSLDYIDIIAPSITCPANTTVAAGANCSATLSAYEPQTLSDNCTSNPALGQSPAASTVISGINTTQMIVLTATDEAGNTKSCTFTITVADVSGPGIVCPSNQIVGADAACAGIVGAWSAVSASDNCSGNVTVVQSPVATTVLNGHNDVRTVTLTATDAANNSQSCTFTVTLNDISKPAISCQEKAAVIAGADCSAPVGSYVPLTLSDNCTANPIVTQDPIASTILTGNNTTSIVTLTATDNAGNTQTCSLIVILKDLTAPSLVCKPFTTDLNAAGTASITAADVFQSGSDNCGVLSVQSVTPNTFTCANIGSNLVTLTANDGYNNFASCTAVVTVRDMILPVAKCKDATVNLGIAGTTTPNPSILNNGSSDNCSFTLDLSPATFDCANIGQNIVTLRATDASGNTATCTAKVIVSDLTGPTAICSNPTIYLDDLGHATLSVAQVNNGSNDACGISSMSIDVSEFNCSELPGSTWPVTLSLSDIHGNKSSCLSSVTVKDIIAPTAVCNNLTVVLGSNGKVTVYGEDLAVNSFDNCSVWSFDPYAKVFSAANMGPNNVTVTVKDWSGNSATCVSVVTVVPHGSNNDFQTGGNAKSTAGTGELLVFPNPATDGGATMLFTLPSDQTFTVRLFDLSGRLIYQQAQQGNSGENSIPLSLNGFKAGVYLVDLQTENWKVQQRMVVQE